VANRYLYVFPGQQKDTLNTIEYLDISIPMVNVQSMKGLKWTTINIQNQDLAANFGFGSVALTPNELLLFGGNTTKTFLFDFAGTFATIKNQKASSPIFAKLSTIKGNELCTPAIFSYQSDYVARLFGNYLYAIDSFSQNLHVYSLKDKIWNFSTLRDLGVTTV
jgi:hypothetical protein